MTELSHPVRAECFPQEYELVYVNDLGGAVVADAILGQSLRYGIGYIKEHHLHSLI